ncbi:uncharacterized protein LOC129602639 [Paramacrobiotus metropolitanus]|uniref:uncharacterized protein LOC129602639 n=1 Tax=Paramacrobiotus metropolitanus TaxID=2943436 RepID=UPI002445C6D2|nr:uncharacterized protein LOC129602639 [Paramacrobiotus metropolitanus]
MYEIVRKLGLLLLTVFLCSPNVNGQLGYAQYQNAMPGSNYNPSMYGPRYGSGGAYNGFSFNPEVGVVGPPGFGGGYEKLGIGQYPFVDPQTYWFLAGVSAANSISLQYVLPIMCTMFLAIRLLR